MAIEVTILIYLVMQDKERGDVPLSMTQMMKGILDGCLLAIINDNEVYGYELAEKMENYGFNTLSEGTIYPILIRMQKEALVSSTYKKSTAGPKRKYYSLTEKGKNELAHFLKRWDYLQSNVNRVVNREAR